MTVCTTSFNLLIIKYFVALSISTYEEEALFGWLNENILKEKYEEVICYLTGIISNKEKQNYVLDYLEKYNVNIAFVNDDINTTTANGKMVSRIMMSVSQNEIERTSERTIIGLEGAIKKGHIPARVTGMLCLR